jgi:hypothetical protein
MMWFSLRAGVANTAVIAALGLLPLISVAVSMLKTGSEQAGAEKSLVRVEQVVWQADPLLAHFVE